MTKIQNLIDKLKQNNVQVCPFVKGIEGMRCKDILALEASEKAGDVNSELAVQYHERCRAFGWQECSLFKQYAKKILKDVEDIEITSVNPLCLVYLNSRKQGK